MFTFQVAPDDGEPYEVVASSRDVVLWERTGKGRSLQRLTEDLRMVDMYELAHLAARRTGRFGGTLAEFTDAVDLALDTDAADGADGVGAGPTRPGR